jgi:23S rRNA G2445 N2-methylase RlmL
MKKAEAIQLLDETFDNEFDLNRYAKFIKELFNVIKIEFQDKSTFIANQYTDYISEVHKIGNFIDRDRKKMEVLAVKLVKTTSRDRARTMQRNFVASWLGKMDIESALVAFYGEEPDDWRFSFVKMEYNLVRDETGKVQIAKELTPAKRYSYLVGVNEPNHTCRSQFLDLVIEEDTNPTIADIEDAFSIDNVTKEFFEKYKELVVDLKESLDKVLSKDAVTKKEFDDRGIATIDFSKKLLGQIVFIYFLQKKGWLGVKKTPDGTFKEWGTGPKRFLRRLYDKEIVDYDNFFNDVLEPLFYDALATPRDNDYHTLFKCKIPFLNGGLFEPINDYDWTGTDILIDNKIFEKILETFDRFNFTVKEDEPLEKEVAVDPEMLGKVFENLLEVKERKDKGAFYTPREIVHYMCQQSLINYLETNTSVSREDIEKFIQYGDLALDLTIKALEQKKKYSGKAYIKEEYLVPQSIAERYLIIDNLLRDIKIVDPAVGSGAFPVGMMNEIVKARSVLTIFFDQDEQEERTDYNLKRETIENSLYGVDIDPSAVEIAKLRFWLSLIVDETEMTKIKPLPNLDHKIMCGNSLLEEFEGIKLFDEELLEIAEEKAPHQHEIEQITRQLKDLYKVKRQIVLGKEKSRSLKEVEKQISSLERKKKYLLKPKKKDTLELTLEEALQQKRRESQIKLSQLKNLQKQYFNEQNRKIKQQLRNDIDKIEWELIERTLTEQGHPEALLKLEQYKKAQSKPFFLWKLNFAEVFQRENPGFDVVIANPPYVDSENMVKNMPQEREEISSTYQTARGNWDLYIPFFELGFTVSRENGDVTYIAPNKWLSIGYGKELRKYFAKHVLQMCNCDSINVFEAGNTPEIVFIKKKVLETGIKVHSFNEDYHLINKGDVPRNTLEMGNWGMILSENLDTLLKLMDNEKIVDDYCDVENPFTVSEAYELKKCVYDGERVNEKDDFKLITTGTIDKYVTLWGVKNTSYIKDKYQYPFVNKALYKKILPKRFAQSISVKIIIAGIRYFECFFDEDGRFVAGKSTIIIRKPKNDITFEALLSILNSSIISFYIREAYSATGIDGGVNFTAPMIKALPIAKLSKANVYELDRLSKEILSITGGLYYLDDSDKVEKVDGIMKQIDNILYGLYRLKKEEIEVINAYNN